LAPGASLYTALQNQQNDLRTSVRTDIAVLEPGPPSNAVRACRNRMYASRRPTARTHYDVRVPDPDHGFDPNFHSSA